MNIEELFNVAIGLILGGSFVGFFYYLVELILKSMLGLEIKEPMRYAVYGLIVYGLIVAFGSAIPSLIYVFFFEDFIWYKLFRPELLLSDNPDENSESKIKDKDNK